MGGLYNFAVHFCEYRNIMKTIWKRVLLTRHWQPWKQLLACHQIFAFDCVLVIIIEGLKTWPWIWHGHFVPWMAKLTLVCYSVTPGQWPPLLDLKYKVMRQNSQVARSSRKSRSLGLLAATHETPLYYNFINSAKSTGWIPGPILPKLGTTYIEFIAPFVVALCWNENYLVWILALEFGVTKLRVWRSWPLVTKWRHSKSRERHREEFHKWKVPVRSWGRQKVRNIYGSCTARHAPKLITGNPDWALNVS